MKHGLVCAVFLAAGGCAGQAGTSAQDGGVEGASSSSSLGQQSSRTPASSVGASSTSRAATSQSQPASTGTSQDSATSHAAGASSTAGTASSLEAPASSAELPGSSLGTASSDVAAPSSAALPDSSSTMVETCVGNGTGTNAAAFLMDSLPQTMLCGTHLSTTITVQNTGTTSWTTALRYSLGTQGDSDPFHMQSARVDLASGDTCIPPGGQHTFQLELAAPDMAGVYTSDWRMVQDDVEWFGDTLARDIAVVCPAAGEDAIDLSTVTIVKGALQVAQWPKTSTLTEVTVTEDTMCTYHSKSGVWPSVQFFDDPATLVEGNQWVFARINGQWFGGAAEWMRPSQQCKGVPAASVGAEEFYNDNEEPLHSWYPAHGELVGVMVSTPARAYPAMATLDERSNVVLVAWP